MHHENVLSLMYATWALFAIYYELGFMIILIDAYNVLKQKIGTDYINADQQRQFVEQLRDYAHAKKHELIVVFDGGSYNWPYESKKKNVTIIFSGERATADDVIKKVLDRIDFQNTVLVSSDRELRAHAAAVRVPSIAAEDFTRIMLSKDDNLVRVTPDVKQLKKETETKNQDLDSLMEKASRIVIYKDEDLQAVPVKQKNGYTLSKKEKKLKRVLKKL